MKRVNLQRQGEPADALERREAQRQHGLIRWQLRDELLEGDIDHPEEGREEDDQTGDHHKDGRTAGHALASPASAEVG